MTSLPTTCDVLVIGGGNAGFSAAIAAKEAGAGHVVLIDKCPEDWAGGNSYFTAGAMRTVHGGLDDLSSIVNNVDDGLLEKIDLDPYTDQEFRNDMDRICQGQSDPILSEALIKGSRESVQWLADHGVEVHYSTAATKLHKDSTSDAVGGVSVEQNARPALIQTKAVILAAGGFEANSRMRAHYLGEGWDRAYVRGTPYNTGDLLDIAVRDISAKKAGNWSGCHCTCWDANAPTDSGDRGVSNEFTKSGYPMGVMINAHGERFVDEGVDYRNYTYAIFGRAILQQPGGIAYQIYDKKSIPWLRSEEYRDEVVRKIHGSSIEDLAGNLASGEGLQNTEKFVQTLQQFNTAAHAYRDENPHQQWNLAVKDGLSTQSSSHKLALPKTHWALPIDEPPFLAVKVTGGITFTFGGLEVEPETTGVISSATSQPVPGLFCAGEMLGGLFYGNYPGGSGLTSGTVFGRRAGIAAADVARKNDNTASRLIAKF
ncbi:FAD/NAD(P)-binding domain-containing protein [Hortaea werneckii]|nr:FAD/NAD(P)-binding domain-containing protein [Hortaea werneckii]